MGYDSRAIGGFKPANDIALSTTIRTISVTATSFMVSPDQVDAIATRAEPTGVDINEIALGIIADLAS